MTRVHDHDAIRHMTVWSCLAVFVGGCLGSGVRITLGTLQPSAVAWPWMTMLINLTGAFILGCLLEYFAQTGEDVGSHKLWRLGLGTGVIGGYTTYSTFILESDTRLTHHEFLLGMAYLVSSVLVGLVCAGLGVWAGSRLATRRGAIAGGTERTDTDARRGDGR